MNPEVDVAPEKAPARRKTDRPVIGSAGLESALAWLSSRRVGAELRAQRARPGGDRKPGYRS